MKHSSKALDWTETGDAAVAVILGWAVFADQLHQDGWTGGGGTLWLLILAMTATAGALIAIVARQADRHWWTAVGLAAAAASPVVFAYIRPLRPKHLSRPVRRVLWTGRASFSEAAHVGMDRATRRDRDPCVGVGTAKAVAAQEGRTPARHLIGPWCEHCGVATVGADRDGPVFRSGDGNSSWHRSRLCRLQPRRGD
jgi:hypothetical protein